MDTPTPKTSAEDTLHLRIVSMCAFIVAGLGCLGLMFLGMHYAVFSTVAERLPQGKVDFESFVSVFFWIYPMLAVPLLLVTVANLLSGWFVMNRRYWMFTLGVSVVNLLQMPVGTAIGTYTIYVLSRPSVRALYALGEPARSDIGPGPG